MQSPRAAGSLRSRCSAAGRTPSSQLNRPVMATSASISTAARVSSQVIAGPVARPSRIGGDEGRPLADAADGDDLRRPRSVRRAAAGHELAGRARHGRPPRLGVLLGHAVSAPVGWIAGAGQPDEASVKGEQAALRVGRAQVDGQDQWPIASRLADLSGPPAPAHRAASRASAESAQGMVRKPTGRSGRQAR